MFRGPFDYSPFSLLQRPQSGGVPSDMIASCSPAEQPGRGDLCRIRRAPLVNDPSMFSFSPGQQTSAVYTD